MMRFFKKSRPSWGTLVLVVWLIATGLLHLVPRLGFSGIEGRSKGHYRYRRWLRCGF